MASSACKDCHAPIDFIQLDNGRWKPVRPGTREFHRCELEQTCADCNQKFQGAPWMKTCQTCFKNSRPGRQGFQRPDNSETGNFGDQPARSKSRYDTKAYPPRKPVEAVKDNDDGFDDIPF